MISVLSHPLLSHACAPLWANWNTLQQVSKYLNSDSSITRTVGFLAVMGVVVILWAVAFRALVGRGPTLGRGTTPGELFRDLCLLHQLDHAECQVVRDLAATLPENEWTRVFTDPRLLRERSILPGDTGRLSARLLNRLF